MRLLAVPEQLPDEAPDGEGDAPLRTRPLHAKLLALVDGEGTVNLLAGSANFTSRGLGGRNREVMVDAALPEETFDVWLARLGAVEWRGAPAAPSADEDAAVPEVPLSRLVTARFEPAAGVTCAQQRWPGVLHLDWQHAPEEVVYERRSGARVPLAIWKEQALELDGARRGLQVKVDRCWINIPIDVVLPEGDDGFWTVELREPDERPDDELWMLLADLRRRPSSSGAKGAGAGRGAASDDGFHLPLDQRLVRLARARGALRHGLDGKEASQQLERYLHPHRELALEAHSIDVGRTILSAYLDDVDAQRHPCCWRCEPS